MKLTAVNKRLRVLRAATDTVARESDEHIRISGVFRSLREIGMSDCIFSLSIVTQGGRVIRLKYVEGISGELTTPLDEWPVGVGLAGSLSSKTRSTRRKQARRQSTRNKWLQNIRSSAAFPLLIHGQVIGVLSFNWLQQVKLSKHVMDALWPFVHLAAIALNSEHVHATTDVASLLSNLRAKRVLVLGKDTGTELKLLRRISKTLTQMDFQPLLVKDHADIPELSNEEKVRLLADASRFVILENSFPAGQIAELKMCATNRIVTVTLRQEGLGSSFMVTDYHKDYDFIQEVVYQSKHLQKAIKEATAWAEEKIEERIQYYDALYPWRC